MEVLYLARKQTKQTCSRSWGVSLTKRSSYCDVWANKKKTEERPAANAHSKGVRGYTGRKFSGVAPCTQVRSCVHMASEKKVIWFWQLNSATNTSKCHHSAMTFQNFPAENPRTPRKNLAPSALIGHGFAVSDRKPNITPAYHFLQTVCLHIIST